MEPRGSAGVTSYDATHAIPSYSADVGAQSAPEETALARVIIVSDVRLYADVLTRCLLAQPGIGACFAAATAHEVLDMAVDRALSVVLVDMGRPESASMVRTLQAARPDLVLVAFAVADSDDAVIASAEAGVAGFVPRSASVEELVAAVHHARRGELLCSPRMMATIFRHLGSPRNRSATSESDELTLREREVVALIDSGMSNKEIASRLNIEVATVKNHVHRILEKLAVRRRGEAAARMRRVRASGR